MNEKIWQLLAILGVSSFPFLFSLQGDFVFDDSEAILKNKDVSIHNWTEAFRNDFWGTNIRSNLSHKSYRPLTILTFKLNYVLNEKKFSPMQYKITNLMCHVICCLLAWKSFEHFVSENKMKHRRPRDIDIAFLAALLFAVHPIHVEAISGIVGRADLLAGITFFLALIFYQRAICSKNTNLYLVLTIICAGLSMLFKENGVTVLGFCIFYDIIHNMESLTKHTFETTFFQKLCFKDQKSRRLLILIISIIILLYGRWKVMGETKPEFKSTDNPAAFSTNFFIKVATFNYLYYLNLLLLIWPEWLCYDWSMGCIPLIKDMFDYRLMLVFLMYVYGYLFIRALISNKNNSGVKRLMLLALALAVFPFTPASNIFYYVGFVIAERVMYIPSAGFCLLVAVGLNKIRHKSRLKKYKVNIVFFFVLVILGLRSWERSFDWQAEYQLYMSGMSVCPQNAKIHYNVAKVADARQQTELALEEYQQAIRLHPEYYQAMNNLANMLKNEKKYNEAETYLRKAIKIKHDFPAAWMNLGIVLANTKRFEEALNAYKNALRYRKNYPDCLYNLANLYLEMKKPQDSIENWIQAIHLNPKHVLAWTNLLALLDNTGHLEKALELIPKALQELPDSPSILFATANIYGKLDRFEEAEDCFSKAIKLFGPNVQALHYSNLGVLYHRWKKFDQAKETYLKALAIDPHFKSAIRNLKMLESL